MTVIAIGYVLVSGVGFFTYTYYPSKFIGYSGIKQLLDMLPYVLVSTGVTVISYIALSFIEYLLVFLVLGTITSGLGYVLCSYFFKFKEMEDLKQIILSKLKKK